MVTSGVIANDVAGGDDGRSKRVYQVAGSVLLFCICECVLYSLERNDANSCSGSVCATSGRGEQPVAARTPRVTELAQARPH